MCVRVQTHTHTQHLKQFKQPSHYQLSLFSSRYQESKQSESTAVLIQQQSLTFGTNRSTIRALYWTILNSCLALFMNRSWLRSPLLIHCSILKKILWREVKVFVPRLSQTQDDVFFWKKFLQMVNALKFKRILRADVKSHHNLRPLSSFSSLLFPDPNYSKLLYRYVYFPVRSQLLNQIFWNIPYIFEF